MARILRGDLVWADLDPTRGHEQGGQRPVIVLSEDVFNARSGTVIARLQKTACTGSPVTWKK